MEAAQQAFMEVNEYATLLAELRRHEPREDLVSAIVNSAVDGDKLGDFEISVFFVVLMIAGNETTRNLIAGGMRALTEQPNQADQLKADPKLIKPNVADMLRYESPANYLRAT